MGSDLTRISCGRSGVVDANDSTERKCLAKFHLKQKRILFETGMLLKKILDHESRFFRLSVPAWHTHLITAI